VDLDALHEAGGLVTRARLDALLGRRMADRALRDGVIVKLGHGRYGLAGSTDAALAHGLNAHLCLLSAALHHGWEVLHAPDLPHVLVPRKRRLTRSGLEQVHVHRRDLLPEDVDGPATSQSLTLQMCLQQLPFPEALAVADSALRAGQPPSALRRAALTARGPGAPQARRVAELAREEAANPFESGLRAIALGVPGLEVRPQVPVMTCLGPLCPDLVDLDLEIVLEADSFTWHGDRAALARDCRRYNALVAAGFIVLRFSWEDVMFAASDVRDLLAAVVNTRTGSARSWCSPA